MLQLHLSDQQFYCLRGVLYQWFNGTDFSYWTTDVTDNSTTMTSKCTDAENYIKSFWQKRFKQNRQPISSICNSVFPRDAALILNVQYLNPILWLISVLPKCLSNFRLIDQFWPQILPILGPVSISNKMSYCKILKSLEATRFVFKIVRSLWKWTAASAAVLPMCLSNFKAMW